jgi:hypothetical protein
MNGIARNTRQKVLSGAIVLLSILLVVSVCKNISYPLLWNDEAETAMFATRVLQYGYPKVHDGKNMLYLLELPDKTVGIDRKTDAYIGTVWGHFYFAAVGELFARCTQDLYLKTAMLRIPFALAGLCGIGLFALTAMGFFRMSRDQRLLFVCLFLLLVLLSVSLALHMREVRYYSLSILFSAAVFFLYSCFVLFRAMHARVYIPLMSCVLVLIYDTFPPAYGASVIMVSLAEGLRFIRKTPRKEIALALAPLLVSVAVVIPVMAFFDTLAVSAAFSKLFAITPGVRFTNLMRVYAYFREYEFLYALLAAKGMLLVLWLCLNPGHVAAGPAAEDREKSAQNRDSIENTATRRAEMTTRFYASNFLMVSGLVYLLLILLMPLPHIYERYFIALVPLFMIVLLFDLFTLYDLLEEISSGTLRRMIALLLLLPMAILLCQGGVGKYESIRGHIYELFHPYQGPLDYVIPYIQTHYPRPADLVIATNYEECAFMYYLGAGTTIGYVGNNLEEDLKKQPDIIIIRKRWAYTNREEIFGLFFKRAAYSRVVFPIVDTPVNNIPEVSGSLRHLYVSRKAENPREALEIYVKQ